MNETLEYLQTFARFPFAVQKFLKQRMTIDEARQLIREQMARRAENFLQVAEHQIYNFPRSPYRALLKNGGCELDDLRALVRDKGLESALRELHRQGVYITFEEFKGRQSIIRNGRTIPVAARDFDNPLFKSSIQAESGGSSGAATRVALNLDHLAKNAAHRLVHLSAHRIYHLPEVIWRGIVPDSTLNMMLHSAADGELPLRWFSHIGLRDSKHWFKYALATYYVIFWMRLYGARVPLPEYVTVEHADVIARAVADLLQKHSTCRLITTISRAVRVCLAAQENGIRLDGLVMSGGGEPITPAKIRVLQDAGVRYIANYAMTEAGTLGNGCARASDLSDIHLFTNAFALITHPQPLEGFEISVPAFNLTTLLPTAPKVMLNLQMDDYGIVEERACGCELESLGLTTLLREIRSYRKLTGEGVTLVGSEILKIIEEVLPARFGGSPLDYQLMEYEDVRGLTRLALIIHPRLAIANEQAVIDVVIAALRQSSPMADSARAVWQRSGTLEIKRIEPIWTARGKLMPLHLDRVARKS